MLKLQLMYLKSRVSCGAPSPASVAALDLLELSGREEDSHDSAEAGCVLVAAVVAGRRCCRRRVGGCCGGRAVAASEVSGTSGEAVFAWLSCGSLSVS